MLKQYKLPKESFIGGWFIPKKICDKLISYYDKFNSHVVPGTIGDCNVLKSVKDSMDLFIEPNNQDKEIIEYQQVLQKVLNLYIKRYPEVNRYDKFAVSGSNIQKYSKNGGFKPFHFERAGKIVSTRVLVFMTYLNDVENGGTKFKYQKITTPSKKGLTLIWPPDFTHTHKSQVVNKEKIIMTGWFATL
tara:strand:- start:695 stop:1261 length:567 start_codon:yes stop_codon:yes gene_type:complete